MNIRKHTLPISCGVCQCPLLTFIFCCHYAEYSVIEEKMSDFRNNGEKVRKIWPHNSFFPSILPKILFPYLVGAVPRKRLQRARKIWPHNSF